VGTDTSMVHASLNLKNKSDSCCFLIGGDSAVSVTESLLFKVQFASFACFTRNIHHLKLPTQ
jgi:hypothetical protein